MRRRSRRAGFTVIELMLVVGILGIIATIAIPAFIRFQLRTKASEVKSNLSAIRVSEEAYHAEYGVYTSAMPVVPTSIGRDKRQWPLTPSTSHGFNAMGWAPEGQVYYQYGVTSNGGMAFTVGARSNLDGDANFNTWGLVKPIAGTSLGIVGPFGTCQTTGVYNDQSGAEDLLNEIGPCNRFSGKTVF
ncbi:MAG: prepilin-type N-terminal cleavage/methylation domain-containing protein [Deltaproteobacteria bacterium]|nr:MAG: prepilin-type N-terminal cleavage/methylation domain-containing protein [Deltaproteobacteria bacterium]